MANVKNRSIINRKFLAGIHFHAIKKFNLIIRVRQISIIALISSSLNITSILCYLLCHEFFPLVINFLDLGQVKTERNSCYNILGSTFLRFRYTCEIILNGSLLKYTRLTLHPIYPFINFIFYYLFQLHLIVKLNILFVLHSRPSLKI
jgi:hypothetical protein